MSNNLFTLYMIVQITSMKTSFFVLLFSASAICLCVLHFFLFKKKCLSFTTMSLTPYVT